jgi:hypothetical protein
MYSRKGNKKQYVVQERFYAELDKADSLQNLVYLIMFYACCHEYNELSCLYNMPLSHLAHYDPEDGGSTYL